MQTSDGINELAISINELATARFTPWLIERLMDKVEATGKNRSGHAVAMYMNKRYGSQLMSQGILGYMRGKIVPRGSQAVELIEAAGLNPFIYMPFAEAESVFSDKRSSYRLILFWAIHCDSWADIMGIETPWITDTDYSGLAGITVTEIDLNAEEKYANQ